MGTIPNLRPLGLNEHVLDGGDRCGGHCLHVELAWRDIRAVKKLSWALIAGVLGLLAKEIVPAAASRGRESMPLTHGGERLAPDRVDEPSR